MRHRSRSRCLSLMAALCLLALLTTAFAPVGGVAAPSAGWRVETSAPAYARHGSLVVDRDGVPHIAYCGANTLHYATRTVLGWTSTLVSSESCTATAVVIDANNRPRIVYQHAGLKYAYLTDSGWQIETVDTEIISDLRLSIALDSSQRPHVLYATYTTTGGVLKYARRLAATWTITAVKPDDRTHPHGMPDLAMDTADHPHICYATTTEDVIRYGFFDGNAWRFETLAENMGYYPCSLALDAAGHPHVSYVSREIHGMMGLVYAHHDGASWHRMFIDDRLLAGAWAGPWLALDAAGHPRVAYEIAEGAGERLLYSVLSGAGWQSETVAALADTLYDDVQLAIDAQGQPHISYQGHSDYFILYATQDAPVFNVRVFLPLVVKNP